MTEYRVIKFFTDLQDNSYKYNVGDIFPRDGLKVTQKRFAELASSKNRQHTPLIKKIITDDASKEPKEKTVRKRRSK